MSRPEAPEYTPTPDANAALSLTVSLEDYQTARSALRDTGKDEPQTGDSQVKAAHSDYLCAGDAPDPDLEARVRKDLTSALTERIKGQDRLPLQRLQREYLMPFATEVANSVFPTKELQQTKEYSQCFLLVLRWAAYEAGTQRGLQSDRPGNLKKEEFTKLAEILKDWKGKGDLPAAPAAGSIEPGLKALLGMPTFQQQALDSVMTTRLAALDTPKPLTYEQLTKAGDKTPSKVTELATHFAAAVFGKKTRANEKTFDECVTLLEQFIKSQLNTKKFGDRCAGMDDKDKPKELTKDEATRLAELLATGAKKGNPYGVYVNTDAITAHIKANPDKQTELVSALLRMDPISPGRDAAALIELTACGLTTDATTANVIRLSLLDRFCSQKKLILPKTMPTEKADVEKLETTLLKAGFPPEYVSLIPHLISLRAGDTVPVKGSDSLDKDALAKLGLQRAEDKLPVRGMLRVNPTQLEQQLTVGNACLQIHLLAQKIATEGDDKRREGLQARLDAWKELLKTRDAGVFAVKKKK